MSKVTVWFTHASTGNEKGIEMCEAEKGDTEDVILDALDDKKALALDGDNGSLIIPFELLQQCFISVEEVE